MTCILRHRNMKKGLPKIMPDQFPLGCQMFVSFSYFQMIRAIRSKQPRILMDSEIVKIIFKDTVMQII